LADDHWARTIAASTTDAADGLHRGQGLGEDEPAEQGGDDGLDQDGHGGQGGGQPAQRPGDAALSHDVHQAEARAGGPAAPGAGQDLFAQQQGGQQQARGGDGRRPQHDPPGRMAVARAFHGDEIARVPEGGDGGEDVAQRGVRALPAVGAQGHGHGPGDGGGERHEEQGLGPVAEHEPADQGHDHGGQVGQGGGVGHRGQGDRIVPEGQVEHEHDAGQHHPVRGPADALPAGARGHDQQPGQGEGEAPEARGGRAGVGQPHQDRREAQHHGREDQHGQGGGPGGHRRRRLRHAKRPASRPMANNGI
jgi:hypothetical protein